MKSVIIRRALPVLAPIVLAVLPALLLSAAAAQNSSSSGSAAHVQSAPRREMPAWLSPNGVRYTQLSPADHGRDEQTQKLLSEYKQTEDEKDRAKILDGLTKVVSEQFDARQDLRERELKELEEQLRKLRELQQRRAKEKDQIVRDRVRQLLRDVDGLGWGDDGPPFATPPRYMQQGAKQ